MGSSTRRATDARNRACLAIVCVEEGRRHYTALASRNIVVLPEKKLKIVKLRL